MPAKPDHMRHWDALKQTDPSHTKSFSRAGGFKGTAIKPIWIIQRITEHFGPVGVGWGMNEPRYEIVNLSKDTGRVMVYCWLECWHTDRSHTFWGVGGDTVQDQFRDGRMMPDDEAFKKAFTDALGNAFKFVGVGADVHMGQFEDSKYVREAAAAFKPAHPSIDKLKEFAEAIPLQQTADDLASLLEKHMDTIAAATEHDKAEVAKVKQQFAARKKALEAIG